VSWREISIEEFDRTIPVSPPKVNKKINPNDQIKEIGILFIDPPNNVATQLKTLIPVGIAIIIVAAVK